MKKNQQMYGGTSGGARTSLVLARLSRVHYEQAQVTRNTEYLAYPAYNATLTPQSRVQLGAFLGKNPARHPAGEND